MLLFPYQQGQQFAMALYVAGGTKAIDDAFRNPPTCTKDILHPEKFLRQRATPEKVELPRVESKDWRMIGSNVLGEFGMRFVLEQALGAFDAQTLAEGWNGDRYNVYERGTNGPTALVWTSAWEDEGQAGEFADAYKKVAEKRGIAMAGVKIRREGKRVTVVQSADAGFLDLWAAAQTARKNN